MSLAVVIDDELITSSPLLKVSFSTVLLKAKAVPSRAQAEQSMCHSRITAGFVADNLLLRQELRKMKNWITAEI
jgi:hypothetical protein